MKDILKIIAGAISLLIAGALTVAANLALAWGFIKFIKWAWIG